jgi:prepilin-type processing-associated H-X9-DG protein
MMVAILLPSLARARELSNRAVDAASLRGIATACITYAGDNGGQMPPNLLAVAPLLGDPKVLKSRSTATVALSAMPATEADLEAHCDWIYAGGDLRNSMGPAGSIVLVYSKDFAMDHGRNFAFLDGHVEWVRAADVEVAWGASNAARAAAGLRPLRLDDTSPVPMRMMRGGGPGARRLPGSMPPGMGGGGPPPMVGPAYGFSEAADDLRSNDAARQRKGVDLIQFHKPNEATAQVRKDVAVGLEQAMGSPALRGTALRCLRTWAVKDNVPGLLKFVNDGNPGDIQQAGDISSAIFALGTAGDASVAPSLAKHLYYTFTRGAAVQALTALGPDAESAVWPYLMHQDFITAQNACAVLSAIGTEKSLPELEKALTTKTPFVKEKAQAAIGAIKARAK